MVSQARVREAAEDLVRVRYQQTTQKTATAAGEDMRDWQLGSDRVIKAAKKAVEATKKQPTKRKVNVIQSQINSIG